MKTLFEIVGLHPMLDEEDFDGDRECVVCGSGIPWERKLTCSPECYTLFKTYKILDKRPHSKVHYKQLLPKKILKEVVHGKGVLAAKRTRRDRKRRGVELVCEHCWSPYKTRKTEPFCSKECQELANEKDAREINRMASLARGVDFFKKRTFRR